MLNLNRTLSKYISRQFLMHFAIMILALLAVIYMFEVIELLRRASGKPDVGVARVLEMALLKLPQVGQEIIGFAVLFAGMSTFFRLTRSHELVVARAAGVSVWQFLIPIITVAALIGVIKFAVVNPVSAILIARYEVLDSQYIQNRASTIKLSDNGLWLRQGDEVNTIFHARQIDPVSFDLKDVMVLFIDRDGTLESAWMPKGHGWRKTVGISMTPGKARSRPMQAKRSNLRRHLRR